MSFFKRQRALSILGWFLALLLFNIAFHWRQNANKNGLYIFLEAIDYLTIPVELVMSAVVVYGIASKRPLISTTRLAAYIAVGSLAIVITFFLSDQEQARDAYAWILKSHSGGRRKILSPTEVFQEASPSVFVVEALDGNGKTLMLGSGVALARDFLITNCHVVQSGSTVRVTRGRNTWTGRLIQAAPNHDLCGLRPNGLSLYPTEVRPSSTLSTGEHVYAIGSPQGLELTFSEGVISALRDTDGVHMIQTSAPISPGSSGGGLFDTHGNLVGITTFYLKEGQSLNFALPGEWVTDVLARSNVVAHASMSDAALESAAWIDIGLEAAKKEDYDLAQRSFLKCADLKQPDAYRAWFELGKIWGKAYEQAKALAAFEQTIRLKPDYSEGWLELSREFYHEKKWPQAIDAAKEAARLDPRNRSSLFQLGAVYIQVSSYKEAIDALQQALRLAPDASFHLTSENRRISSDLFPSDSVVLFVMGEAYSKEGNREQVTEIYKKLQAIDPKLAENFFQEYVLPKLPATVHPKKIDPVLSTEAAKFKERIEEAIIEKGLTGRVKVHGTGNTLVLSGKLRPAEHGALLRFLLDAPASVHVVDQIEYDDAPST
jgi:tetratricopeptide (TPR) repeat protein